MASTLSCRLCGFTCDEFKNLFDDNGQTNAVYQVTVKYFSSSLLESGMESVCLKVICMECWQHIIDFHSFRQWILNAQAHQEEDLKFIKQDEISDDQISVTDKIDLNDANPSNIIEDKETNPGAIGFISKIKGELKCHKCKELFSSYVTLDAHLQKFHFGEQSNFHQKEDLKFIKQEEISDDQISVTDKIDLYDANPSNIIEDKETNPGAIDFISKIKGKFKCHKCKELFSSYVTLDAHLQKFHFGEQSNFHNRKLDNPFICDTCGASFTLNGNLKRHIRRSHAIQPLFKWICKYCNKLFKTRFHLESHKRKTHTSQLKIDLENDLSQNTKKNYDEYIDDIETDSESEEMKIDTIYEHSNQNSNDSESFISKKKPLKVKIIRKKFSINEPCFNKNVQLDLPSSSTDANQSIQINKPALDIVDIKSEICTDTESEADSNNLSKNISSNGLNSTIEQDEQDDYIRKWKRDLECPKCSELVSNYTELNEHFTLEHPEEHCYIICCETALYERTSITEHLKMHEDFNDYKCLDCGKCFTNSRGLSSHKLQVHSDKRSVYHLHVCYCKRAKELHAENKAKGIQMEYDDVVCCHRKKKILEDDALIAEWKKELTCEICNAQFSYYSLMRAHFYNEHPGEKCYISCCQRKMSRVSDALAHIRFHLDPHAYRCKICTTIFSSKSTLAKHMRNTHSDSLPKYQWACDECDKSFEIRQILTRHKNVVHSKQF